MVATKMKKEQQRLSELSKLRETLRGDSGKGLELVTKCETDEQIT